MGYNWCNFDGLMFFASEMRCISERREKGKQNAGLSPNAQNSTAGLSCKPRKDFPVIEHGDTPVRTATPDVISGWERKGII
jgi:hypothetical protein